MVLTCAWIWWTCRNKHVNEDEHVTCRCNILWFVVHNYGCHILWENGLCVIYIYMYIYEMLVTMECKKQKKIKFLPLCRGQWPRPSTKKGPLPRALAIALGKDFFGKILKISLPRAREEALGKKIQKKPFLCRGSALGKETANGAGAWRLLFFAEGRPGPRQRLCRVPDKGPSAKTPL